jgi:hypothetical protein
MKILNNKFTFAILIFLIIAGACQNQNTSFGVVPENKERAVSQTLDPIPQASPSLTTNQTCGTFVEGTPVGISCLQCSHVNAQRQAIQIAETLRDSCRKNIALSVLLDGTFGSNRDLIGELVRISSEKGARLHLYIYLGNGPWQRRTSGIPNRGFGTGIKPEEFRSRILNDQELRERFRLLIKDAEPLISYANTQGAVVYVMPMLEDNLSYASAREMELITRQTIIPQLTYSLGRNPCPNCYPGNDTSIANGLFMDQHVKYPNSTIIAEGGLVTNDGRSFAYPWEINEDLLSFEDLKTLIYKTKLKNSTYLIWRKQYQGLISNTVLNDPDSRTYEEITFEQRNALLEILRTP